MTHVITSLQEITYENIDHTCFPIPIIRKGKSPRTTTDFLSHGSGQYETKPCPWHAQLFEAFSVQDWELREAQDLKNKAAKVILSPDEERTLNEALERYAEKRRMIEEKEPQIIDHVERRIALFFQLLVLCYRTPFTYKEGVTVDQYGKGHSLRPLIPVGTQGAHSATIPNLYAIYTNEAGQKKKFVFLKGSQIYVQNNSTMELPAEVNKLDSLLDFQLTPKFRKICIDIINKVARGELTPEQGTRVFLANLKTALERILDVYQNNEKKKLVLDVCQIYLRKTNEVLNFEDALADQLMGVRFDGADDEEKLRKITYESKYRLIQQAHFIESQIVKRIIAAQHEIFGNTITEKATQSVDWRIRYILLQDNNPWRRKCLQKLFCVSIDQLTSIQEETADLRAREIEKVELDIEQIKRNKKIVIENLQRDIHIYLQEILREELIYRSQLFQAFRKEYKNWGPARFVNEFKALFPNDAMSKSMVWRLENNIERDPSEPEILVVKPLGKDEFKEALKTDPSKPRTSHFKTPRNQRRKVLDEALADKVSRVLGTSKGLLRSGFFYSAN